MKKSVQLIHPIGHDRSKQKKSMRDEELIKAEHFSTKKRDPTVQFGQFNQKEPLCYMLGAYVTRSITAVEKKRQASVNYSIFSRSSFQPTVISLIERATVNLIKFYKQLSRKGDSQATTRD